MSSLTSAARTTKARPPLIVGAAALVVLILVGIAAPRIALHGWLIAFGSAGFIPLGAFAWMIIHRLTGGRWGELAGPGLTIAISMLPLLAVFWLPLGIANALVYPWGAYPASAAPGVATAFLNGGAFALRSLIGLVGFCLIVWFASHRGLGRLWAGLALLFYAIFMNFAAFGWLLSLDPRFASSAFGVQIIVQQLISALAFVAVAQVAPRRAEAWKDIGSLLLATTLGESYLILMTFIVLWYGDLPDQAAWYLHRTHHGWLVLELFGVAVGSIGPLVALLFSKVRDNPGPLRIVGACLLAGTFVQTVWLVAPVTEAWSIATGLLAVVAMVGLCWGLRRPMGRLIGGMADAR